MSGVVRTLRNPRYVALSVILSTVLFTAVIWVSNFSLLRTILSQSDISMWDKTTVLMSFYSSIGTNFTILSASYTIGIIILFSINLSMIHYGWKQGRSFLGGSSMSMTGVVSGMFGIGCTACGPLLISTLLPFLGLGGLVALLPFGGEEFGILGFLLLAYSTWVLSEKITAPITCPIEREER